MRYKLINGNKSWFTALFLTFPLLFLLWCCRQRFLKWLTYKIESKWKWNSVYSFQSLWLLILHVYTPFLNGVSFQALGSWGSNISHGSLNCGIKQENRKMTLYFSVWFLIGLLKSTGSFFAFSQRLFILFCVSCKSKGLLTAVQFFKFKKFMFGTNTASLCFTKPTNQMMDWIN